MKIEWQSFGTETPFDINCNMFEKSFIKTSKYKLLISIKDLKMLDQLRANNLFKPQTEYISIDVRGKIIFNYQDMKTEYCFDQFGHFDYVGKLFNNKSLWMYITKIITKSDQ